MSRSIESSEGERILAEVRAHPRCDLIRAIAEALFDINNENGLGGGMWFHLSQAYALVEMLPALSLGESAERLGGNLPVYDSADLHG